VSGGPAARSGERALRAVIFAGILYDWLTAALIFLSHADVLAAFRLPQPADPFHFKFAGLLLLVLPFFYVMPWREPRRYARVIGAMIAARLAGFAYLSLYGGLRAEPATYALFGVADLAFAVATLLCARRAGLSARDLAPFAA
jgi:hypothetical protein